MAIGVIQCRILSVIIVLVEYRDVFSASGVSGCVAHSCQTLQLYAPELFWGFELLYTILALVY
jgi:hypothetical protein